MAVSNLSASKREDLTHASLNINRKKGNIPGIFYFRGKESIPIYVKDVALNPFIYTSEVSIINLNIDGTTEKFNCILKDIQFDPISDKAIHFDLLGISENEKIKVEIPLSLVGTPVGIKEGGVVQHSLHKIEVECFPKDIPSHIDVNIENLNIGDSIRVSDLKYDNFEILENENSTIVAVVPPTIEKVEEAAPVEGAEGAEGEPTEPEVIAKGKKDEDEEPEEKKK